MSTEKQAIAEIENHNFINSRLFVAEKNGNFTIEPAIPGVLHEKMIDSNNHLYCVNETDAKRFVYLNEVPE